MAAGSEPVPSNDEVVRLAARAHEHDRYLAALLSPRSVRSDLIALAAFAGEIGRIPLFVNEPMMGRIRLQWWRERIESCTSAGHPVAEAMITTMQRHELPAARMIGLVEAHEDGLDDRPFDGEADLLSYVDRIDGTLFELAARIIGIPAEPALVQAAGRAYGLARIVFETPAALAHGRLLLPLQRPAGGAGADEARLILDAVRSTAALARRNLAVSAAAIGQLPRSSRSPFLAVALVEPYLRALEHLQELPRTAPEVDPSKRAWRLLRCRWTGRTS